MREHPSTAHIAKGYLSLAHQRIYSELITSYVIDGSSKADLEGLLVKIEQEYPKFVFEPLNALYLQYKEEIYGGKKCNQ